MQHFNIKSLNIYISTFTNQLTVSQLITKFFDVAPIKSIQNTKISQEECI